MQPCRCGHILEAHSKKRNGRCGYCLCEGYVDAGMAELRAKEIEREEEIEALGGDIKSCIAYWKKKGLVKEADLINKNKENI